MSWLLCTIVIIWLGTCLRVGLWLVDWLCSPSQPHDPYSHASYCHMPQDTFIIQSLDSDVMWLLGGEMTLRSSHVTWQHIDRINVHKSIFFNGVIVCISFHSCTWLLGTVSIQINLPSVDFVTVWLFEHKIQFIEQQRVKVIVQTKFKLDLNLGGGGTEF